MKSVRLTISEVKRRLAERGYELLGEYKCRHDPVRILCTAHGVEKETRLGNIFKGGSMACCAKESMREKNRVNNAGAGNPFFGKKHSILTREAISKKKLEDPNRHCKMPDVVRHALAKANTGKPRSEETKRKLREHMARRYRLFSFCERKASQGKTAGKQGIFYIVRIGELLKFGSATTTMSYRLTRIRQKHGQDVELKMYCLVDDAGEYESTMMRKFKSEWVKGEYFNNFLDQIQAKAA